MHLSADITNNEQNSERSTAASFRLQSYLWQSVLGELHRVESVSFV